MSLSIDALQPPHRVSLVKIDVGGREFPARVGMRRLLERDHSRLNREGCATEAVESSASPGYGFNDQIGFRRPRVPAQGRGGRAPVTGQTTLTKVPSEAPARDSPPP